jgi:hypothetical protein
MNQRNTKKTTKEFKEEMKIKNPYIEILGEYVTRTTKILARDTRCGHTWNTSDPAGLLRGYGCPECAIFRKEKKKNTTNRLGEIKYNKEKEKMIIINYKKADDIDVEFEDGTIVKNKTYTLFSKGQIFNPYSTTVYKVGYIGVGKYLPYDINNKVTKEYDVWKQMLNRCYNENNRINAPSYKDCLVCDEWHNFQKFAKWYHDNYYEVQSQRTELDKDILYKGNKIYSPNTCIFVPKVINTLFISCKAVRGKYPIGVTLTTANKFRARCNNELLNERIHLGVFKTPEKAFESYKKYKEKHIKEVADYYKDEIPNKLYQAMYRYEVEITD